MMVAVSPRQASSYESTRPTDCCFIFIYRVRRRQTDLAVARRSRLFHGVSGYNNPQHGGSCHLLGPWRSSAEHEGGAGELYAKPCGFHPYQWMDGGSIWNPSRICLCNRSIHLREALRR